MGPGLSTAPRFLSKRHAKRTHQPRQKGNGRQKNRQGNHEVWILTLHPAGKSTSEDQTLVSAMTPTTHTEAIRLGTCTDYSVITERIGPTALPGWRSEQGTEQMERWRNSTLE